MCVCACACFHYPLTPLTAPLSKAVEWGKAEWSRVLACLLSLARMLKASESLLSLPIQVRLSEHWVLSRQKFDAFSLPLIHVATYVNWEGWKLRWLSTAKVCNLHNWNATWTCILCKSKQRQKVQIVSDLILRRLDAVVTTVILPIKVILPI